MKKKVYISLPITGRQFKYVFLQNYDASSRLTSLGFEAISPLDNDLPLEAPRERHMRADIKTLTECDAIYLCQGYAKSRGCMTEEMVAKECGLKRLHCQLSDKEILSLMKNDI